MLVTTKYLAKRAKKNGYAFGSFNTSNLEITKAIISAAINQKAPISIETSEGEINYAGAEYLAGMIKEVSKKVAVPIALHLDHGKSIEMVLRCLKAGYTSVHIDGSALLLEENIKLTKSVVKLARKYGASVEGEIGHIEGGSSIHNKKLKKEDIEYAKPEDVKDFVRATGVDLVAVGIGSGHGLYKNEPKLDFERLQKIHWITNAYLVLHGSSGISPKNIKKAIKLGISKINVNTDLRIAFTQALRKTLVKNKKEVVPYNILPPSITAVQKVVEKKIEIFEARNKA